MFRDDQEERPKSRIQRKEEREEESMRLKRSDLYLTGISTMASVASATAIIIASLNRKKRHDDDGDEPVYYMSESMGLVKYNDRRR